MATNSTKILTTENILLFFVFLSMLLGQFGRITLGEGVAFYIHDVAVCAYVMLSLFQKKIAFFRYKALIPFIGAAILSLGMAVPDLGNEQVFMSALYLVRWLMYASLIGVVVQEKERNLRVGALYGFSLVLGIIGLTQLVVYPDLRMLSYIGWDPHYMRVFSTLLDPNFTGLLVVMGFLLGMALLEKDVFFGNKIYVGLAQVILFIALVLTYSRSTFVAFMVGLFCWVATTGKKKAGAAILGLLILVLSVLHSSNEWHNLFRVTSSIARVENAAEAWQRFLTQPIFGYGFNTLRYVQCESSGCVDPYGNFSRAANGVDNSMLFLLVTTGIVGLGAYVFLIYRLYDEVKKNDTRYTHTLSMGLISVASAVLAHSLFINSLFYSWVMIWLWMYIGALLPIPQGQRLSPRVRTQRRHR